MSRLQKKIYFGVLVVLSSVKLKKRVSLSLVGLFLAGTQPSACASEASAAAPSLTLTDAVSRALLANPVIDEARANRQATEAELAQARGLYLPQLDAQVSYGLSRYDYQFRATPANGNDAYRAGIVAKQLLFDGSATRSEVARQAARTDSATLRVLDRSEAVALNTTKAYLDILRFTELVSLAEENVRRHRELAHYIDEKVAGGAATAGDKRQAEGRVQLALLSLIDVQSGLEAACLDFIRTTGLEPVGLVLPSTPAYPYLPDNLDNALADAFARNPTLLTAEADIDTAYAEWRATRAAFTPKFTLEGSVSQSTSASTHRSEYEREASLLVVMRYNLFRGGIDRHDRIQAIARIDESRQRSLQTRRSLENLTRQAWLDMQTSDNRVPVIEAQLAAEVAVTQSYREQFAVGRRSLLDVLNSQTAQFNASIALSTARFTGLYARYRVIAATGWLLAALETPAPAEAAAATRVVHRIPPTVPDNKDTWQPVR